MRYSLRVMERLAQISQAEAAYTEQPAAEPAAPPAPEPAKAQSTAGVLTLICVKCTRQARIQAPDREAACRFAAKKGWDNRGVRTICPKCPK